MPKYNRGGNVIKTGKIGRVQVLRQQILLPGEILRPSVQGTVRLTPFRERHTAKVHARIDAFIQPLRWLWAGWPKYLADGESNSQATRTQIPVVTTATAGLRLSDLGIGGGTQITTGGTMKWFVDGPLRIFNEWWKWPEDVDATDWFPDGMKTTNLPHNLTRLQKDPVGSLDADNYELHVKAGTPAKVDVRGLASVQAHFKQAMDQKWIAHERYIELLKSTWNAQGNREVDKVPIRLKGAEAGVNPRDVAATNSDGLGSFMALFNFGINHDFGRVGAPEHMLVTYMLCVRFAPIFESEGNPMAFRYDRRWSSLAGIPAILGNLIPQAVRERNIHGGLNTVVRGYLPAGWEWRGRWNLVDNRVEQRNSFPVMRSMVGLNATQLRDPTRIGSPFLSQSLGDYIVDLEFDEPVDSPIPGPISSVYAGMKSGSAYPYPGPSRVI